MTALKNLDVCAEILEALEREVLPIEYFGASDIETLPIGEVIKRLDALEEDYSLPSELQEKLEQVAPIQSGSVCTGIAVAEANAHINRFMEGIGSAMRLTDTTVQCDREDLSEMLKVIGANIGISHIAYLAYFPRAHDGTYYPSISTAITTYSVGWQTQYFRKNYVDIDPVVAHGRNALLPFDWETLASDDPIVFAFFADAAKHGVGRNGLSVPVRNRKGSTSLVSFTSNHSSMEWAQYKLQNKVILQNLASLIDSVVNALTLPPMRLSMKSNV
jgi:hypothetical protein